MKECTYFHGRTFADTFSQSQRWYTKLVSRSTILLYAHPRTRLNCAVVTGSRTNIFRSLLPLFLTWAKLLTRHESQLFLVFWIETPLSLDELFTISYRRSGSQALDYPTTFVLLEHPHLV